MTIVVDASVVIKIITEEPGSEAATLRVMDADERIAPAWVRLEVTNGLSKKVHAAGLTIDQARSGLGAIDLFLTELVDTEGLYERAFSLSIDLRHAMYDCLYLALAEERGGVLVTADAKFLAKLADHRLSRHVELIA